MKFKSGAFIIALFTFLSCGSHEAIPAFIFERKQLNDNRIRIKYQYTYNGKTFFDSAVVENLVIPHDTIDLIINPSNPAKGLPDIKR